METSLPSFCVCMCAHKWNLNLAPSEGLFSSSLEPLAGCDLTLPGSSPQLPAIGQMNSLDDAGMELY